MPAVRALTYAILLLALPAVAADVYRWVDEKGTVHYSNEAPPKGVKATKVDVEAEPRAPVNEGPECYTVRCQGERLEERLARSGHAAAAEGARLPQVRLDPPRHERGRVHHGRRRARSPAVGFGTGQDLHLLSHSGRSLHHDRGFALRPRERNRARAQVLSLRSARTARGLHLFPEHTEKETHMDPKDKVEGEGSYTGTKDYNKRTKKFVNSGKVEEAANDAAPKSEQEAREMENAERVGSKPAKD